MGEDRPVKIKCWEKFLEYHKCKYKSTNASHHKWKCPNCLQPIIFRGSKKEIPSFHIKTNLRTMGIPADDFYNWIKDNC